MSFLENDNKIDRLPTGNSASYVFYSESEDYVTLYPWTYCYDTTSFREIFGPEALASDIFNTDNTDYLYDNLTYYFYRMVPGDVRDFLYNKDNKNIRLSDRINYEDIESDLKVKQVDDDLIFYYSKDFPISNQTYNLSFSFMNDFQILSFQIKPVSNPTLSKDDINSAKEFLSGYINSSDNFSIFDIYYDILYKTYSYELYLLKDDNTGDNEISPYDENDSASETSRSIVISEDAKTELIERIKSTINSDNDYLLDRSSLENTSYQLVYTNNEFLIIFLENNIVLHYDPITSMITGFNLSESYLSLQK